MMLSPLDTLFMDEDEQLVVSVVTRQPQLPIPSIAEMTGIALEKLEQLICRLVQQARLIEERIAGQIVYSARYGRVRRGPKNMPSHLDLFG